MSAPVWRVEVHEAGADYGVRLHVGAQSFAVLRWTVSREEAEWHARMAEHAMRAVEVAVLRLARNGVGGAFAWAAIDQLIAARLPDCAGCTDPASEGTHAEGTRQHP